MEATLPLQLRPCQSILDRSDEIALSTTDLRAKLAVARLQPNRIPLSTASQIARLHPLDWQPLIASRGLDRHDDVQTSNGLSPACGTPLNNGTDAAEY